MRLYKCGRGRVVQDKPAGREHEDMDFPLLWGTAPGDGIPTVSRSAQLGKHLCGGTEWSQNVVPDRLRPGHKGSHGRCSFTNPGNDWTRGYHFEQSAYFQTLFTTLYKLRPELAYIGLRSNSRPHSQT